jgi:hypothetical protein
MQGSRIATNKGFEMLNRGWFTLLIVLLDKVRGRRAGQSDADSKRPRNEMQEYGVNR